MKPRLTWFVTHNFIAQWEAEQYRICLVTFLPTSIVSMVDFAENYSFGRVEWNSRNVLFLHSGHHPRACVVQVEWGILGRSHFGGPQTINRILLLHFRWSQPRCFVCETLFWLALETSNWSWIILQSTHSVEWRLCWPVQVKTDNVSSRIISLEHVQFCFVMFFLHCISFSLLDVVDFLQILDSIF
jgi:hypothetical protein